MSRPETDRTRSAPPALPAAAGMFAASRAPEHLNLNHLYRLSGSFSPIVAIIAGGVLLLFGRRIFWLVVGVVGFLAVYSFTLDVLRLEPEWVRLVLAVLAGLVGIVLAIMMQKVAVAIAGFLIGAGAVARFTGWHLPHLSAGQLLVVLVVGLIFAVLAVMLFDLALVVLSSIAGAGLIVDALHVAASSRLLISVVLIAIGVVIQLGMLERGRVRA